MGVFVRTDALRGEARCGAPSAFCSSSTAAWGGHGGGGGRMFPERFAWFFQRKTRMLVLTVASYLALC
jgi:hypothetical protein